MIFDLPAMTPEYEFQGAKQSCIEIDQEFERVENMRGAGVNPYVVIFGVDEHSFEEVFMGQEKNILQESWVSYDPKSCAVKLKRETTVHAVAGTALSGVVLTWARQQNQDCPLFGTSTHCVQGITRGQRKRADCAFAPDFLPAGRSAKWPTLAAEVRWPESESASNLREDLFFWLYESSGDVNVVLSVTLTSNYEITIERWALHSHLTRTSHPFVTDKVTIKRAQNPDDPPLITGSLTITLEELFLRPKRRGDTDLTIGPTEITQIAREVWAQQNKL